MALSIVRYKLTLVPPSLADSITNMASALRPAPGAWSPNHSRSHSRNHSMSDPNERGAADELDTRTPLDRTIDRIGMGASELPKKPFMIGKLDEQRPPSFLFQGTYQWTLLSLCGFGEMPLVLNTD